MDVGKEPLNLLEVWSCISRVSFDCLLTHDKRMPIAFGPMPGPRQTVFGKSRESTESTFTTGKHHLINSLPFQFFETKHSLIILAASIKFKTSRTLLQNLFPPNSTSYRFKSPGTVAYASFSQTTLNKMDWLGGSGYKHIGLYIHGVEYVKKNGDIISGTCELQSPIRVKKKVSHECQQTCHSSLKA